ncbi:MAG: patatin-like phospholipase family protein [Calditrichaeota bacterium]|nr:patatin-like phospholipase family protein [Calditrichota bacterium]MCB0304336.1 patatin-like phospholipase family protein [Calditrichota bacterium]
MDNKSATAPENDPLPQLISKGVFARELAYIQSRWDTVYQPKSQERHQRDTEKKAVKKTAKPSPAAEKAAEPGVGKGLVGLAFSGGGIRSATFNLGIAQALYRRGIIDHVDYLSTVSGGGYLGASLSTIMRQGGEFPFPHVESPNEPAYVEWLRNNSNYLATRGFIDYVRLFAILLRGILINLLVLLPPLLIASVLFSLYYGGDPGFMKKGLLNQWLLHGFDWRDVFQMTPYVALAVIGWYIAFPVFVRSFKVVKRKVALSEGSDSTVKFRDKFELSFAFTLLLLAGIAMIEIFPIIIHFFHEFRRSTQIADVWTSIASGGSIAALVAADKMLRKFGKFGKQVMSTLIGLLGLLLPLLIVLYVTEALVYGNFRFSFFDAGYSLLGLSGEAITVLLLAVATWLFCWLFVDINFTSIHGVYRDRLASAFLVTKNRDSGRVEIEKDVNLDEICQPGSRAPYHLINVALNLQGSKDPRLRERKSDFFFFSKYCYGGERTGYASSEALERVFPQMDLSTAMAISAAAASPNSGSFTYGSLVALMTLFNIRLGYWVPNPRRLAGWAEKKTAASGFVSGLWDTFLWRIRPSAIIKEMRSKLNEEDDWVNVSDGGHIENLAIYELLRRHCKFIIAGDGEADPAMKFGGLATLIRYARIDLGIEIDIKLDDLCLQDGKSRRHCAFGYISYPPAKAGGKPELGYLLYIKSSVTGDEDLVISEYRARKGDFPHESTADQFFDEGQFEAYRALGYHAADGLFPPVGHGEIPPQMDYKSFAEWFEKQMPAEHGDKTTVN